MQATHALKDIALAVRDLDSKVKGKLKIELTIERTRGTGQLLIQHRLEMTKPTESGKATEQANGDTMMYCNREGELSVVPDAQTRMDFNLETNQ